MWRASKTVNVSLMSAPYLLSAKIVQTLMLQVGSKSARGINVKVILSANNLFATKDTVTSQGMEIGEAEEMRAT